MILAWMNDHRIGHIVIIIGSVGICAAVVTGILVLSVDCRVVIQSIRHKLGIGNEQT